MASWVPSPERHREIVSVWREARTQAADWVPVEVLRGMSFEERRRRWWAAWNPFLGERKGQAWQILLDQLADRGWHRVNPIRDLMVEAGHANWKGSYVLIWSGIRAGALEERRPRGSRWLKHRLIRLRNDCPKHLLRPPKP